MRIGEFRILLRHNYNLANNISKICICVIYLYLEGGSSSMLFYSNSTNDHLYMPCGLGGYGALYEG